MKVYKSIGHSANGNVFYLRTSLDSAFKVSIDVQECIGDPMNNMQLATFKERCNTVVNLLWSGEVFFNSSYRPPHPS